MTPLYLTMTKCKPSFHSSRYHVTDIHTTLEPCLWWFGHLCRRDVGCSSWLDGGNSNTFWNFHPENWGRLRLPIWETSYFSMGGWLKPPTRWVVLLFFFPPGLLHDTISGPWVDWTWSCLDVFGWRNCILNCLWSGTHLHPLKTNSFVYLLVDALLATNISSQNDTFEDDFTHLPCWDIVSSREGNKRWVQTKISMWKSRGHVLEAFCFQANGELEGGLQARAFQLISRNGGWHGNFTLPETNELLPNSYLPNRKVVFPTTIFTGYVELCGCSTFSTGLFGWFKHGWSCC